MTLGNRIRNYREEHGVTQVELASKVGISQGYLSEIEKDRFNPKAPTIIRLAKALGISTDELLGLDDERIIEQNSTSTIENLRKTITVFGIPADAETDV